jgi:hypothetical protein
MSLTYNGTELQGITYNGADVQSVTMDGVEVWRNNPPPPFLVRMRYDASQSTHVKDLVGGYTITTDNGAVPAADDPFGGNNALNLNDVVIKYGGAKQISGEKSTVACWVKLTDGYASRNNHLGCSAGYMGSSVGRALVIPGGKVEIQTSFSAYPAGVTSSMTPNIWHYLEVSTDGNIERIFIDGILSYQGADSRLTSAPLWKHANYDMWIGGFSYNYDWNKLKGHIYDYCILNGVWHTENYNVPTAYI